jgi:acetyl esterase/lipase
MSLSAEILRLGMRWFVTRGLAPDPQIELLRRQMQTVLRFVPGPPRGTLETEPDVGAIKAVRVATPQSLQDRHVLYLHGGGYVMGAPAHYRDFLWRIARVSSARVLCPSYRLAPEHPFPAALDVLPWRCCCACAMRVCRCRPPLSRYRHGPISH